MDVERTAALVCAWLATYFVHSTLLLGAAWLTTRKLPTRLDGLSEMVWRGALVLPVVTTVVQGLFSPGGGLGQAPIGAVEYTPQPLAVTLVPAWMWIGGATVWIVGALAGLGQLYVCHRRLQRQIAGRTTLPQEIRSVVAPVLDYDVRVSLVHGLAIPFALTREICLPEWLADRMDGAELRAVVAHELAHVRRRDAFWRIATAALRRCFFFQPLNWIAFARLRELSECICDDEAVAATKSAVPLAAALETVARRAHRHRALFTLAPAMGAPVSLTVRRIGRILSAPVAAPRVRVGRARQASALVIAASAAVLFAPRVRLPVIAFMRYTINGEDPAGPFTVILQNGRVVSATVAGRTLLPQQVRQSGSTVRLLDRSGVLSLQMTPGGGIKWDPRKPIPQHM